MRMPWVVIGKATVWVLAYGLAYSAFRIAEVASESPDLRGLYRAIVHFAVGMALGYVIFMRPSTQTEPRR